MLVSPSPSVGRSLPSTSPVPSTPEETCPRNYPTKSVSARSRVLSGARRACTLLVVDYARDGANIRRFSRRLLATLGTRTGGIKRLKRNFPSDRRHFITAAVTL